MAMDNTQQENMTMHITDWFPTLLSAAGADPERYDDVDGVDQWPALTEGEETQRNVTVYNLKTLPVSGNNTCKGIYYYPNLFLS